jgi:hypothetical protein
MGGNKTGNKWILICYLCYLGDIITFSPDLALVLGGVPIRCLGDPSILGPLAGWSIRYSRFPSLEELCATDPPACPTSTPTPAKNLAPIAILWHPAIERLLDTGYMV